MNSETGDERDETGRGPEAANSPRNGGKRAHLDHLDDAGQLWALPPLQRALHWASIPLLLAIVGFAGISQLAQHGPWNVAWVFVLIPLLLVVRQLRAVLVLWLDPETGQLVLFRAAGGALHTRARHVRRLDHGALATLLPSGRNYRPIRLVTDHGTATLSVFFPDPYDLATTLRDTNPDLRIDL